MRHAYRARCAVMACALAVTTFAGASAFTNAASNVPKAVDRTYADPVYRSGTFTGSTDEIELDATRGAGGYTYEIVQPPEVDGETAGSVTVDDGAAELEINVGAEPGTGTFSYRAVDASGVASDPATVTFEVANKRPLTRDVRLTTARGTPLDIWPYARDAEDGGAFLWESDGSEVSYAEPDHGSVEDFFTPGGGDEPAFVALGHKAVYVPDPGFTGVDRFAYTVSDPDGGISKGTIEVKVTEPREQPRGVQRDIRYRCQFHMTTDGGGQSVAEGRYDERLTSLTSRMLGGDIGVSVGIKARGPESVRAGRRFTLSGVGVDVRIPRGMAEILGGNSHDLDTAGFGQSSLGARIDANMQVETPDGKTGVSLLGSTSEKADLLSPAEPDGLTLPIDAQIAPITAPRSGEVAVSAPRVLFLDLTLEPGVLGVIDVLGLRCDAVDDDVKLLDVPVEQVKLRAVRRPASTR